MKNNIITNILSFLCLASMVVNVQAQESREVTGTVTDINGEPLIGATVMGQKERVGTITDFDGNFTLNIARSEKNLTVTYVGYTTKTIPIGNGRALKVKLTEQTNLLDEMVVIGYGAVKKGSVTASVSSVKGEDLERRPVANIASALQGELAGVEVRSTTGMPGASVDIKVRGATSINESASSAPLYVVDGVPMDENFELSQLNANDIQSIEVLKDASSSAIYGSRGANGVVIITSKRGDDSGKPQLRFNASFGLQQAEHKMDIMSSTEWIAWRTRCNNAQYVARFANKGAKVTDDFATRIGIIGGMDHRFVNDPRWSMPDYGGLALLDWQDELFRLAPNQSYSLSASHGTKQGNYRLSVGYTKQDGIVIKTGYEKLTAQFSGESRIKDRLTMGLKVAPTVEWTDGGGVDGKGSQAMTALTQTPVAEGDAGVNTNSDPYERYYWATGGVSPIARMNGENNRREKITSYSSTYLKLDILEGLTAQILGAWNYYHYKTRRFIPSNVDSNWSKYQEGYLSLGQWTGNSSHKLMAQAQVNYNRTWGKHNINAVAGWSLENTSNSDSYSLSATHYPNNAVEGFDMTNEDMTVAKATYVTDDRLVSYFGRVIYNYGDRYLLNASIRRDGSSRFGSNNRWGTFPAFSAAWHMSNETFWPKDGLLSDAKLRVSYGSNGSRSLPISSANGLMTTANYSTNGTITTGYLPSSLENPDLTWQKTNSWDMAIDLGLLHNRISMSIDYYQKTIKDMLYNVSMPSDIGFATAYSNIGNIETKGLELELKSDNLTGRLKWTTTLNIAYSASEVKDLGENSSIPCGWENSTQIIEAGKSIGEFYLYKAVGVYQTQEDLDNCPKQTTSTLGSVRYKDINDDGVIDTNDRTYCGHPSPDFTYGLTNTFRYKNWSFSMLVTAQTGGKIYGALGRAFDRTGLGTSINVLKKYKNMWFSVDDPGDGKTPCIFNTSTTEEYDTRWLYSSDFVKIKNVTLGYNVPLRKTNFLSSIRINASIENLYMWDKYEGGYSPESNNSSSLVSSWDYGAYPLARTYSIGVNLLF